jgi:hypothetical protein
MPSSTVSALVPLRATASFVSVVLTVRPKIRSDIKRQLIPWEKDRLTIAVAPFLFGFQCIKLAVTYLSFRNPIELDLQVLYRMVPMVLTCKQMTAGGNWDNILFNPTVTNKTQKREQSSQKFRIASIKSEKCLAVPIHYYLNVKVDVRHQR